MASHLSSKQKAFLSGLTLERAAFRHRSLVAYKAGDFETLYRLISTTSLIDDKIQRLVGCSCTSDGSAECGGMEFDEATDSVTGTMCDCECHDRIMASLPDHLKASVEDQTFQYPCTVLLRIFEDTSLDE